jgi:hypothetical protein
MSSLTGLAIGAALGAGVGYAIGNMGPTVTPEIATLLSRMRVIVKPPGGTPSPYTVYFLQDPQTVILEAEGPVSPTDWFQGSAIIGLEDRGLPYDNRGHGEGTLRLWWGKSPNHWNFTGNMWFIEGWLGGAYPKELDLYNAKTGQWVDILDYAPGGNWAIYKEVLPDGSFD